VCSDNSSNDTNDSDTEHCLATVIPC